MDSQEAQGQLEFIMRPFFHLKRPLNQCGSLETDRLVLYAIFIGMF